MKHGEKKILGAKSEIGSKPEHGGQQIRASSEVIKEIGKLLVLQIERLTKLSGYIQEIVSCVSSCKQINSHIPQPSCEIL
jgi:hypothetical protein